MHWTTKASIRILGGGVLILLAPPSLWLLSNAETRTGRCIATAGLIASLLPLVAGFTVHKDAWRGRAQMGTALLAILFVVLSVVIIARAPSGNPGTDSPVQHRFTKPVRFPRYSLANLVPEVDQTNLGFFVMAFLDPIYTRQQARHLISLSSAIYHEMDQDENFRELGTVLGWSYSEMLGPTSDQGHYYLYVPKHRNPGPLPAILFLHGAGGNFKSYLWIWSRLAEQHGYVIISPSSGFGSWRPGQVASALKALNDAATITQIDTDRVYLAGLSNGGLGVSRLAAAAPDRFRGLVFISPVFDRDIISSADFQNHWRGRPALVLTGDADDRVPVAYVQQNAALLKSSGMRVDEAVYPREDHFLIFSQATDLMGKIHNWLQTPGN